MEKHKTTKYMNILTTIGYFIGFGFILLYIINQSNYLFPIIGVIIIFAFRTIGYAIDRTIEYNDMKKR